MLVAQAKEAAEWFTGTAIEDSMIDRIYRTLSGQMQNIVLIGMPGCGKSTLGKALAEKLHRNFADADELITKMAGKSIPEIFAQDGEQVFRKLETEALAELGKQSALVISTGGGCVTQQRNYPLLHQNGKIFWLKRDVSRLPTNGRPLSQANKLEEMYCIRKPLYESFADCSVDNNSTVEACIGAILAEMEENP